jgi:hypothetical protein
MDRFFSLEPEVAGGLGDGTVADTSVHPPVVSHLHYEFEGWLGDELVESFPCYLVTEVLGAAISRAGLSGFSLAHVETSCSPEFTEFQSGITLPAFQWLRISGVAGQSDLGLSSDHLLVVSERALQVIGTHGISNCAISEWR